MLGNLCRQRDSIHRFVACGCLTLLTLLLLLELAYGLPSADLLVAVGLGD